jgi:hypothetical protein
LESGFVKYAIRLPALVLVWALVPGPGAYAQAAKPAGDAEPPIETVTVTGQKQSPLVTIHNFVSTFAVTSPIAGVITRWREAICPGTIGLTAQFNDTVTARLRKVAEMVGAKLKGAPCKPNIIITFTSEPEALLTAAKERNPYILGTGASRNYAMTHSIQAWYGTATVDLRGNVTPDTDDLGMTNPPGKGFGMLPMAGVGGVPTMAREGSLIRDGMGSTFSSVFIVVDLKKVRDAPLSAIADYVTMLALAQTEAYDSCEPLTSISNLMAGSCAAEKKSAAMTPSDIAFLRGIYKTDIGASSLQQQANIASEMESAVPAN